MTAVYICGSSGSNNFEAITIAIKIKIIVKKATQKRKHIVCLVGYEAAQ